MKKKKKFQLNELLLCVVVVKSNYEENGEKDTQLTKNPFNRFYFGWYTVLGSKTCRESKRRSLGD